MCAVHTAIIMTCAYTHTSYSYSYITYIISTFLSIFVFGICFTTLHRNNRRFYYLWIQWYNRPHVIIRFLISFSFLSTNYIDSYCKYTKNEIKWDQDRQAERTQPKKRRKEKELSVIKFVKMSLEKYILYTEQLVYRSQLNRF